MSITNYDGDPSAIEDGLDSMMIIFNFLSKVIKAHNEFSAV